MAKRIGANSRKKRSEIKVKGKKTVGKLFRLIFFVALICVAGVGIFKGAQFAISKIAVSPMLSIKSIEIRGNHNVSTKSILKNCGIKVGEPYVKVNVKEVKNQVLRNPWILNVEIKKNINGVIRLKVKERQAIALYHKGTVFQIDKSGVFFPISENCSFDLPLISGLRDSLHANGIRSLKNQDCARLNQFLANVKKSKLNLSQELSQVNFASNGEIQILFQGNKTLFELDSSNYITRLTQLDKLRQVLPSDSICPVRVDFRYDVFAFVENKKIETINEQTDEQSVVTQ